MSWALVLIGGVVVSAIVWAVVAGFLDARQKSADQPRGWAAEPPPGGKSWESDVQPKPLVRYQAEGGGPVFDRYDDLPEDLRTHLESESVPGKVGVTIRSESSKTHYTLDVDHRKLDIDDEARLPKEIRSLVQRILERGRPAEVTHRIRIEINGKTYEYASPDEIPEEVRRQLPPGLLTHLPESRS